MALYKKTAVMTKQLQITQSPDNDLTDYSKKIDLDKALSLRYKGLTYQEIADYFGCSKQAVWERVSPLIQEDIDIKAFIKNEDHVNASKRKLFLQNMTEENIKKINVKDSTWCYGVLKDKAPVVEIKIDNIETLSLNLNELIKKNQEARDNCMIIDAEVEEIG
jgi:predicted DNA-binding protein (UPF0251 family)